MDAVSYAQLDSREASADASCVEGLASDLVVGFPLFFGFWACWLCLCCPPLMLSALGHAK